MESWKDKAEQLYFVDHLKIVEVSQLVGKTRQAVSEHLHKCAAWRDEELRRKKDSVRRRRIGKLKWERSNRAALGSMRREHEQAVRELSAERYY